MNIISLKGYTVKKLRFGADVPSGQKIILNHNFSYNVRYGKNGICVGTFEVKVFDKSAPDKFFVELTLEGGFAFDSSAKREEIHVASFKELFAYARSIVSSVTALCGVTPIIIPQINIENENIYRIETDGLKP